MRYGLRVVARVGFVLTLMASVGCGDDTTGDGTDTQGDTVTGEDATTEGGTGDTTGDPTTGEDTATETGTSAGVDDVGTTGDDTTTADTTTDGDATGMGDATGGDVPDTGDVSTTGSGTTGCDPFDDGTELIDCNLANCAWCPLVGTKCQPLEPGACISDAEALVVSGDVEAPSQEGIPQYPSCMQPTCDPSTSRCTLSPIKGCCATSADCVDPNEACILTDCPSEPSPPDYLSSGPLNYCTYDIIENCCAGGNSQLLAEGFSSFPNLPSGWTQNDQNIHDRIEWVEMESSDDCFSAGTCLRLGYRTWKDNEVDAECNTYSNQPLNADCTEDFTEISCTTADECALGNVCVATGKTTACTPADATCNCNGTAIAIDLAAPPTNLQPAGEPWAMSFRLKMDTEPPSGGLPGDALQLVATVDGVDDVLFDSAVAIGNSTGGAWKLIALDLSKYSGRLVSLTWRFDTRDSQLNHFGGIQLDDIDLATVCENKLCNAAGDSACATDDKCDVEECAVFQPKSAYSLEADSGFCNNKPIPGCQVCTIADDCDSPPSGASTTSQCDGGVCIYVPNQCLATLFLAQGFEAGIPGTWLTVDDNACSNVWATSANRSTEGASSLHFGQANAACAADPLCGGIEADVCPTYECSTSGLGTIGSFQTDPVSLPVSGTLLLTFDLFLSSEHDAIPFDPTFCDLIPGFCTDRLNVYAVDGAGTSSLIWDSYQLEGATTECGWDSVTVNLAPFAGKSISLRFEFDSGSDGTDSFNNKFEGPWIDNFKVEAACLDEAPCAAASDCPDTGACDIKTCSAGVCQYQTIQGCCINDADCDDGNGCTTDNCGMGNQCEPSVVDQANENCCAQDSVYWAEDFEGSALPAGWEVTVDPAFDVVKWQWEAAGGAAGSAGIYFGDPATSTYCANCQPNGVGGTVKGSIAMPPVVIPPGGIPTLRFDMLLATEFAEYTEADFASYLSAGAFFFDRLRVLAQPIGTDGKQEIWRSEDGNTLSGVTADEDGVVLWQRVGIDLSLLAGQEVVLHFEFDSLTGDANNFEGVRIDNLELTQACSTVQNPEPCLSGVDCLDGDVCTNDSCVAGVCSSADAVGKEDCCFAKPIQTYDFSDCTLGDWGAGPGGDTVAWHPSEFLTPDNCALRFGNPNNATYSACTCEDTAAGPSCEIGCNDPASCKTQSGKNGPAGTITSPAMTIEKNADYTLSFDMYSDMAANEGDTGFVEAFTAKVIYDHPTQGQLDLATLVCHAGVCDFGQMDPCEKGINFTYPGCNGSPTGDYKKWNSYSFNLSEVLCGSNSGVAETLLATLAVDGSATIRLKLQVDILDSSFNCGSGLYLDNVGLALQCTDWAGTCK